MNETIPTIEIDPVKLRGLLEYNTSNPTLLSIGKRWRTWFAGRWWVREVIAADDSKPYVDGEPVLIVSSLAVPVGSGARIEHVEAGSAWRGTRADHPGRSITARDLRMVYRWIENPPDPPRR